jgi:hypothetical protein
MLRRVDKLTEVDRLKGGATGVRSKPILFKCQQKNIQRSNPINKKNIKTVGRGEPVLCIHQQKTFQPINHSTHQQKTFQPINHSTHQQKTTQTINQKNQFGISNEPD